MSHLHGDSEMQTSKAIKHFLEARKVIDSVVDKLICTVPSFHLHSVNQFLLTISIFVLNELILTFRSRLT